MLGILARQPLDGRDRSAFDSRHRHRAGAHRSAIDVHGAAAAERDATTELRSVETEVLTQHPQQRRVRVRLDGARLAIDDE